MIAITYHFNRARVCLWCISKFAFQYLTKQSTTLKEVNDNRLKVYEQLEISIAELELKNKTLEDESKEDKHKLKR